MGHHGQKVSKSCPYQLRSIRRKYRPEDILFLVPVSKDRCAGGGPNRPDMPPSGEIPGAFIMNRHKITTARRVGEVSSKYGYQPELFERDLEQHAAESEALWQDFRAWMIERKVDPEKLRFLFLRLWEEFLE